jgi:hypothetical protein
LKKQFMLRQSEVILEQYSTIRLDGRLIPGNLIISTTYMLYDISTNKDPSADSVIAEKLYDIEDIVKVPGVMVDSLRVNMRRAEGASEQRSYLFHVGMSSTCDAIKARLLDAKEASSASGTYRCPFCDEDLIGRSTSQHSSIIGEQQAPQQQQTPLPQEQPKK